MSSADTFVVVVNHEEQYSVWFADREVPAGWRVEGTTGTREECLDHIERIWTDMRPLSLRQRMAGERASGSR
jgi:MbtH protein